MSSRSAGPSIMLPLPRAGRAGRGWCKTWALAVSLCASSNFCSCSIRDNAKCDKLGGSMAGRKPARLRGWQPAPGCAGQAQQRVAAGQNRCWECVSAVDWLPVCHNLCQGTFPASNPTRARLQHPTSSIPGESRSRHPRFNRTAFAECCCSQDEDRRPRGLLAPPRGAGREKVASQNILGVKSRGRMCLSPW